MRIVLFVPAPFDTVSGGYFYDRAIVAGLRADGHEVIVAELDGRHPLADDAAIASATAAWQAMPADAVPVIDGLCLPAFAPLADAFAARRAVALIHHPTALEPDHDAATRMRLRDLECRLMPLAARVIVTGTATGERLVADFGVTRECLSCVEPAIPDAPRSEGSGGPGCALLSIGVITPRKGHDVLLRALAMLPDLDWTLTLVGGPRDAAHARDLVALADALGIAPRVTFAGEVVDGGLEALWRRADVFTLASLYEGYGMALAEALRRGLPVAVTDTGASSELVPADAGVVVPVGDSEVLGKALRRMVFDTQLRAQMAEAAWRAGRRLPDWQTQARAFAAALAA